MAVLPKAVTALTTSHENQSVALALCIAVNVSAIIWGPPGAGKTAVLSAIAKANNLHLEQILASTKEPPDFAGFPFIDKGVMRLAPPAWAHNIISAKANLEKPQMSIAFFDELSTAVPATQAACLTTILDRKAGEAQMPMGTRMIAAANPPKVAANGWDLTPPMANRFTHLDWELDAKTIARGLQIGWKPPVIPRLPSNIKALIKNAEILVGSYIESSPSSVKFDFTKFSGNSTKQEFRAADNAWPSARSWTTAAKLFAASKAAVDPNGNPLHPDVTRILLEGTIGVAEAIKFLSYVASLDLPSPVDVLNNPEGFELSNRGDILSNILAAVQHEALSHRKSANYGDIWLAWGDVITRIVNAGKADVATMFARDWYSSRPNGTVIQEKHLASFGNLFERLKQADSA